MAGFDDIFADERLIRIAGKYEKHVRRSLGYVLDSSANFKD